jgi:succinate dehydrogenase/fumarate reductase cytochrome b subunit
VIIGDLSARVASLKSSFLVNIFFPLSLAVVHVAFFGVRFTLQEFYEELLTFGRSLYVSLTNELKYVVDRDIR